MGGAAPPSADDPDITGAEKIWRLFPIVRTAGIPLPAVGIGRTLFVGQSFSTKRWQAR